MSTSCMQAIKQQLEAMPLEEFEDLLKEVAVNKGHEGMPQHAELLSQLKHHVKVQPDEPIQTKASDKDCRTFWKSLNQRDKSQRISNNSSSSPSSSSGCSNLNGNVGSSSGNHNSHYNHHKHSSLFGSSSTGNRSLFPTTGDQNANPVSSSTQLSSSDTSSAYYQHHHQPPVNTLNQGKYQDYNNHHHPNIHHHHSTLAYGNCVSGPESSESSSRGSRRSYERDSKNDNTSTCKNSYNAEDDQDDDKPEEYTGTLPAQYILPSVTKSKDLPLQFYPTNSQSHNIGGSPAAQQSLEPIASTSSSSFALSQSRPVTVDTSGPSSSSWSLQNNRNNPIQLSECYPSVSSVTSGNASYGGRSSASALEQTHGTIRAVSPTLPSSAIITRSSPIEGSQFDKRRIDRKKKSAKNVLRETVINPQEMPGYKGNETIDKLLEFVEGNHAKINTKTKNGKEKKREVKPKGGEKQVLSKAASLDENTLEYGSKNSDDATPSRTRNSKEVEKKNATNITKSSTAIATEGITIPNKPSESSSPREDTKPKSISSPLVNGSAALVPKSGSGGGSKPSTSGSAKPPVSTKTQQSVNKSQSTTTAEVVANIKHESVVTVPQPAETKPGKQSAKKAEEVKLDESDGPYVLVQSKKKKEKKKSQQREQAESFVRPHTDQPRRENARTRRCNTERRKSVGSVPGSENDECSDDDDSVRSLPAGECTPRERIPKPCSSSGGTPQTSYADIARMSRDENGKIPSTPIALLPPGTITPTSTKSSPGVVGVPSDTNFPALSPPSSAEKTASVNTAVWPCRPRAESEPTTQENANMQSVNLSQEIHENDNGNPCDASQPSVLTDSSKCSPKLSELNQSDDSCKIAADLKEISQSIGVDELNEMTLKKSTLSQINAGDSTRPREVCSSDPVHMTQMVPGSGKGKRVDEKKGKDKSSKFVEEPSFKAHFGKYVENGDLNLQLTEPVVFCGGKFDNSQLPVGQTIGFEFGFGVIEALNDSGISSDVKISSNSKTSSVDMSLVSPHNFDVSRTNEKITRSQDSASLEGSDILPIKSSKKEQISKSQQQQFQDKKARKGSSKSHGSSLPKVETVDSQPSSRVEQISCMPPSSSQLVPSVVSPEPIQEVGSPVSSGDIGCEGETTADSAGVGEKTEVKKSHPAVDIAQMYVPPPAVNVPDSVYEAIGYMDNYAKRLASLSKSGQVSYHRL